MKKILRVVDMQKDFIDWSLGTKEAVSIVPSVIKKIETYEQNGGVIYYTMDTHFEDYLETPEGKKLPVQHCIKNTEGWKIPENILRNHNNIYEKYTFGSKDLFDDLKIKVIKMEMSNGSGYMANHDTLSLDSELMHEAYKMANEHNLIFVIDIGRPNNNCYQIDNLANAIKKYPSMKFVVCHLTAPQHNQMDILIENMQKLKLDNVYFDIAALPNNTKQPYPFIEAQEYIRKAIDIVGVDKIIWGSDFPSAMNYCSYKESYDYIENSELFTKEEKNYILYLNAKRVFFNE